MKARVGSSKLSFKKEKEKECIFSIQKWKKAFTSRSVDFFENPN